MAKRSAFWLRRALCAMVLLCAASVSLALGDAFTVAHPHWGTGDDVIVTMDFVFVGDRGNAGEQPRLPSDTRYYGGVDYNYRIGTYAVTADQWNNVSGAIEGGLGRGGVEDTRTTGNQPVNFVSWYGAAQFCNWLTSGDKDLGAYAFTYGAGGAVTDVAIDRAKAISDYHGVVYVLPDKDEWYKAAYYKGGETDEYWLFATQQDGTSGTTGTGQGNRPDPVEAGTDFGTAVYSQDSWANGGRPADVDNAGGLSFYGTMAQSGNMWEWTEMAFGSQRIRRGGAFYDVYHNLQKTNYGARNPDSFLFDSGFRVALIPEPGSVTMLVAGALGLLLWRRRGRPGGCLVRGR